MSGTKLKVLPVDGRRWDLVVAGKLEDGVMVNDWVTFGGTATCQKRTHCGPIVMSGKRLVLWGVMVCLDGAEFGQ